MNLKPSIKRVFKTIAPGFVEGFDEYRWSRKELAHLKSAAESLPLDELIESRKRFVLFAIESSIDRNSGFA